MKLNQFLKSMFYLTVICIYYILNMLTICFLTMMVITSIREIELRCFNVLMEMVYSKVFQMSLIRENGSLPGSVHVRNSEIWPIDSQTSVYIQRQITHVKSTVELSIDSVSGV